jgi:hypothetical protein
MPQPAHWKMSETYWTRPRRNSSPLLQITSASSPDSRMASRSAACLRCRSAADVMCVITDSVMSSLLWWSFRR